MENNILQDNDPMRNVEPELAKFLFLRNMSAMKAVLSLGEMKFGGRKSSEYKLYKKVVMDEFYNAMVDVLVNMEQLGYIQKCNCNSSLRQGYNGDCAKCNGAGWCNVGDLDICGGDPDPH